MKTRNSILLLAILVFCLAAGGGFFIKANAGSSAARRDNVQFTGSASQDDFNVYGAATLSESSPSGLSYRITVTVTSPSGRSNTTQSDWRLAPVSHTTGLSIGDEDGTFNIQATFESQNGTYDEYNSFTGTGNTVSSGSSVNTIVVAP